MNQIVIALSLFVMSFICNAGGAATDSDGGKNILGSWELVRYYTSDSSFQDIDSGYSKLFEVSNHDTAYEYGGRMIITFKPGGLCMYDDRRLNPDRLKRPVRTDTNVYVMLPGRIVLPDDLRAENDTFNCIIDNNVLTLRQSLELWSQNTAPVTFHKYYRTLIFERR